METPKKFVKIDQSVFFMDGSWLRGNVMMADFTGDDATFSVDDVAWDEAIDIRECREWTNTCFGGRTPSAEEIRELGKRIRGIVGYL